MTGAMHVPHESDKDQIPHTSEGLPYPDNYVTAAIDRREDAERAAEALRQAGFDREDVVVMHAGEVIDNLQFRERHRNFVGRILAQIKANLTDEGLDDKRREHEAYRGHSIVNVYAPDPHQVERARDILAAHGAHDVKHYGEWTIEDLTSLEGV
jgi:hypothetical protein